MGDLINKGKRPYEVFRFVKEKGYEMLVGNHEFYCMNRLRYPNSWDRLGGRETGEAIGRLYGLSGSVMVQPFLAQMSYFFEQQSYYKFFRTAYGTTILATHGGISRKHFDESGGSVEQALLARSTGIRPYIFNKEPLAVIPNLVQVIGHQPTEDSPRRVNGNYYIDSGCVYNRRGMGYLSALMFNLNNEEEPLSFRQYNID